MFVPLIFVANTVLLFGVSHSIVNFEVQKIYLLSMISCTVDIFYEQEKEHICRLRYFCCAQALGIAAGWQNMHMSFMWWKDPVYKEIIYFSFFFHKIFLKVGDKTKSKMYSFHKINNI